jgi:Ca2+-binding EF-hand superfamily protein
MKFLFEVFDFNEEGSLCYENVALMLINVCNATYKIFSMPKTVANPSIEEFLDEYFTQESEISYHQLLRWTLRVS